MKLSDYLVEWLSEKGIDIVFGYPGGAVTHIIDSIYKSGGVEFIGMHHEQGAAFAAEGYARVKGIPGVAVATSGPGATNFITGIGSAFFDSVPCIYITGQVNTYEYKGDLKIRQLGFQETDIVEIVRPVTKYAALITRPETIKYELEKAFYIATSGRKGPVLLDIPMNIQRAEIDEGSLEGFVQNQGEEPDYSLVGEVVKLINSAERPVILTGGGCRLKDQKKLEKLLDRTQIPVVSSLMGLGLFKIDYENYYGLIGTYGNRYGNFALANSDLILALGSRLDSRQIANKESFAKKAKLVRVDVDHDQLKFTIKENELPLLMGCEEFINEISKDHYDLKPVKAEWISQINDWKARYKNDDGSPEKLPNRVIEQLAGYFDRDTIVVSDVGQNQMWVAQSLESNKLSNMLFSGGMGAMGFSLPAAIGAYYADRNKKVVTFSGDGGLQMNIQELQTVKRNNIPVKIILLNNECLGMIRHFQEKYFSCVYAGTIEGYDAPDFLKIGNAYGIDSVTLTAALDEKVLASRLQSKGPALIDIRLPKTTYVFPKLEYGRPIQDQDPLIDREEYLENMKPSQQN